LIILTGLGFAQADFDVPESAAYDPAGDRYFVANVGSGDIIQIRPGIDTTLYNTSYSRTMGMFVMDNRLWVCTNANIAVFDLTTDLLVDSYSVPGSVVLNDVAADSSGYLWITDSDANRVYRVRISDHDVTTVIDYVYWPNGILYDYYMDRVLFCSFGSNAPIRAINPDDLSVMTLVVTPFTDLDGLGMDNLGRIYVSSWGSNTVYRYTNGFSADPDAVSTGHNGPADIFYCRTTDHLVVPNFHRHTVDFLDFSDVDGDLIAAFQDNCPDDPNPNQDNHDTDSLGDACDEDDDNDGVADTEDNCPLAHNPNQYDFGDGDSIGDECDNCLTTPNPDQQDTNGNGIGDACDPDCCDGRVGDANNDGNDAPTIGDISVMIDAKFIAGVCSGVIGCLDEADVNQSGGESPTCEDISIGDISYLIDYMFITGTGLGLPDCP
jgi:streptogramin lyase